MTEVKRCLGGLPALVAILGALMLSALLVNAVTLLLGHVFENIDLRTHFRWAYQFSAALAEGVFYPRWMPLANFGLGEPSFVIVHPGYYYVISGFHALGLSIWDSIRAAAVGSTFFLGVVTYFVLRDTISAIWSFFGAVSVQASPFVSFLFGYHAALPWHFSIPIAVLAISLSVRDRDRALSISLVLAVAALCLTHLLVAFMVLVCVGVMQIVNIILTPLHLGLRIFSGWVGSVLLGVALAAVYVLLAATSGSLFSTENRIDEIYLNWRNSFIFPVVTSRIFGVRWGIVQWIMPIVPLTSVAITSFVLYRNRSERDLPWAVAARLTLLCVIGLLMASELVYPLYATVPFLTNVQWPYRFLTVASVAGGLALPISGFIAFRTAGSLLSRALVVCCFALSLLLFVALQVKVAGEGVYPRLGLSTLTGNVAQKGAEPASIGPKWQSYLDGGGMQGYCARNEMHCEPLLEQAHQREWRVVVESDSRIVLPLFSFPAWTVSVDGQPSDSKIDNDTGLIELSLAAGTHEISVKWTGLWQERVGLFITLATLFFIFWLVVIDRLKRI